MIKKLLRVPFLLSLLICLSVSVPAEAQDSAAQGSPLAGGGGRKLLDFVNRQGSDAQFDPQVTQMLGLTTAGQVLQLKQIGVRDDQDGIHAVNLLKPSGFLFVKIGKNINQVFQTDVNLNLKTALAKQGGTFFSRVPNQDAASAYQDELEFWAAVLDWKPEKK